LLDGVKGLRAGVTDEAALAALDRLVAHVEAAIEAGEPDPGLGADKLALLMGDPEAMVVDLGRLAERADRERDRLRALLAESCERLRPGADPTILIPELMKDHPTTGEEIYAEARQQIEEATAFTLAKDLLPDPGGVCNVGPAPESRRWAMAMMSWSAPFEPDAPSWYHVTPPDQPCRPSPSTR
jgi:hypothetical protein